MIKVLKLNLYILLFCGNSFAQVWNNYTIENTPLTSNQINSIAINNDGTVWFATDSGLTSQKNDIWNIYYKNDGLSSNKIRYINTDNNHLFAITNAGLDIFDIYNDGISNSMNISKTENNILSDSLNTFSIDSLSRYWLGSELGLSILTNDSSYNVTKTNGLSNEDVNAINTEIFDWVHIGTNGGGVNRLKYDAIDGITSASDIIKQWSGLASDTVLCIYVTDDTLNWYGTTAGVSTHYGNNTKSNWWIFNTEYSEIIDNYVRSIVRDTNGTMWFGTRNGLSSYNPINSLWNSYNVMNGLISNNIFDLKIDNQNTLWIATDQGISRFSGLPTNVKSNSIIVEEKLSLSVFPNPFNPSTTIEFSILENSQINLSLYNVLGMKIKTIVNDFRTEGKYFVELKLLNNNNKNLSSGIYFITLETKNSFISEKILYLK